MTTSDYLLNGALLLVVLRQIRGRRLAGLSLYLPLLLAGYAAIEYLHTIPTAGNDLDLIVGASLLGLTLGSLCGRFTHVYPDHDGVPFAKAGVVAAVLWVLGVGARIAFSLDASHGGGEAILQFDHSHGITTIEAWVAALILMAILEAVGRTAVLIVRARRLPAATAPVDVSRVPVSVGGIMGGCGG